MFRMEQGISRRVIAVTCSKCEGVTAGSDKPNAPLDVVIRHFAEKGFLITERGRRAVCPDCQRARPERRTADESDVMAALDRQREAEQRRAAPSPASPPTDAVIPVDEATRVTEEIRALLEQVPLAAGNSGRKRWQAAPAIAAKIVLAFYGAPETIRGAVFANVVAFFSGFKTSILLFGKGLDTAKAPWPDLRAELSRAGFVLREAERVHRKESAAAEAVQVEHVAPQSRDARRAAARMYALLDQHFAVADGSDVGSYADGWSDDRVAQESGLSASEVIRTREDVYGRLAEDPRVAALEAKLEHVLTTTERDVRDLTKMAASIREQVDIAVADLRRQIADLRKLQVAG